jgi:hypothetical protein
MNVCNYELPQTDGNLSIWHWNGWRLTSLRAIAGLFQVRFCRHKGVPGFNFQHTIGTENAILEISLNAWEFVPQNCLFKARRRPKDFTDNLSWARDGPLISLWFQSTVAFTHIHSHQWRFHALDLKFWGLLHDGWDLAVNTRIKINQSNCSHWFR